MERNVMLVEKLGHFVRNK